MNFKQNLFLKSLFKMTSISIMNVGEDEGGGEGDSFDNIEIDSIGSNDNDEDFGSVTHEDDPKPEKGETMSDSVDNKQIQKPKEEAVKKSEPTTKEEVEDAIDMLKGKYGDTDYDMHPDTMFNHGEEEVSLNQLLDSYQNSQDYETQFNEFENTRESFGVDKRSHYGQLEKSRMIENQFNDIKEMAHGENMIDSFYHTFDSLGLNSDNVYEELVSNLFPDLDKVVDMDEVELRNYTLNRKNEFMTKYHSVQSQRVAQERQRYELTNEISNVKKQHGISDESYRDSYDHISKLKQSGSFNHEINPANIAQIALQRYVDNSASDLLEGIQKGLSRDREMREVLIEAMDKKRYELGRDFTPEELEAIKDTMVEGYELEVKKSDDKKSKKKTAARKKVTTKKQKLEDDFFDDDDDY